MISPPQILTWFHVNKCSIDPIFHQNSKIREKVQKLKTDLCIRSLIFFFPLLLIILSGDPLVGNNWTWQSICKVVRTSSTSSSYNSNMLLTHWCFSINNLMMSYIINTSVRGTKALDLLYFSAVHVVLVYFTSMAYFMQDFRSIFTYVGTFF